MAANQIDDKFYRIFLAIPLQDCFGETISQTIYQLKAQIEGAKWVLPEQVHITLHFFGETSKQNIETIKAAVHPIVKKYKPLNLNLEGVGFFPNPHRPRIIWLGVREEQDQLSALQSEIERELAGKGFFVGDRPFKGHATIGRIKSLPHGGFKDFLMPSVKTTFKEINSIVLYQSLLSPKGPTYEILETFYFTPKPRS